MHSAVRENRTDVEELGVSWVDSRNLHLPSETQEQIESGRESQ